MSFLDAILEKQELERRSDPMSFDMVMQHTKLIDGETAALMISEIVDPSTCYMRTEVIGASSVRLVGKQIEMNNSAPFLMEVDHQTMRKFKVGGVITLKCLKRSNHKYSIFVYDYRD